MTKPDTDWVEGAPPEYIGSRDALIVIEMPHPLKRYPCYQTFTWRNGNWGWSSKAMERHRAIRWIQVPLPKAIESTETTQAEGGY